MPPHRAPWFFAYSRVVSGPLSKEYDRIERTFPDDISDDDPRWETLPEPDVCYVTPSYGDTCVGQNKHDAEFIAAARAAVPALLDELERLRLEMTGLSVRRPASPAK